MDDAPHDVPQNCEIERFTPDDGAAASGFGASRPGSIEEGRDMGIQSDNPMTKTIVAKISREEILPFPIEKKNLAEFTQDKE